MVIVLFTSENEASNTIANELKEYFEEVDENKLKYKNNIMIDMKVESVIDFEAENYIPKESRDWKSSGEYIIVLSPHKSSAEVPALTTHCPGNWGKAEMGGKEKTLSIAYGSKMLIILKNMYEKTDISVSYEADHHGPTVDYPILFVELGNPLWKSKKHAKIISDAVMEAIESNERYESYLGFGGNHYMAKHSKLAIEREYAFTHLLPKHAADFLDENMFKQAIEKNVEKIEKIILDKKGLRKEHRDYITKKAEKFGLDIEGY